MKHSDVVAFIKAGGDETWLLVVDPEADQHFKSRGVIPTSSHVRGRTTDSDSGVGHTTKSFEIPSLEYEIVKEP